MKNLLRSIQFSLVATLFTVAAAAEVVPLDGTWLVEEGVAPDAMPASFSHQVAVPGLTRQAQPAFADVDHYETHEFVWTMKRYGVLPASESCEGLGRTRQKRMFFWYERTFRAPVRRDHATLVVNKAQFGTAVWLNGTKIGEHAGCFTAGHFDLSRAMNWNGDNRLVIRIGAHPGAMPDWAFWGSDGEKGPWTPGIYDRVELRLANNPVIEEVQVAPRIGPSEIVVQTRLKNFGGARTVEIVQHVKTWKGKRTASQPVRQQIQLAADEEKTITQTVPVPNAILWCPENPFLYSLESSTGGDLRSTRFGMREFRFDRATRLPMLNGKVCYLRGSSITLHRFFGDEKCGGLPWDESWVRKLLDEIPRRMHWNAFRICIGPAPQQWLDIADEAGLLLQYEFPIWSDREPMRHKLWHEDDIIQQVREFMRDNWNHPSVVLWDASNETNWDFLREKLVPAVRGLDLSGRPWENGYLQPQAPEDPYETHPYQFINHCFGEKPPFFQMTDLERVAQQKPPTDWRAEHAAINNEYDWLWLHRDGTPTHLTRKVYEHLLGPNATPQQRFALSAYLLGGLTEFWRAQRQHAGVLYLAYLDGDLPHVFTCDNFRDVARLQLEPQFEDYLREAFKPLGVYLDFWQTNLTAGAKRSYRVTLVNDTQEPARGRLVLAWQREQGGNAITEAERNFEVAPVGRASYEIELAAPALEGRYLLRAEASWAGKPFSPTLSRRQVNILTMVGVSPVGIAKASQLWAGVAKADITDLEAKPVNDPLYAKALVLKDDVTAAVIVTVDAVAIGQLGRIKNDFLPNVRLQLQKELNINPSNVLINASHCHGVVCADVEQRTVQAVKEAWRNMVPVNVGAGVGREDRIMENRRLKLKNGSEADVRHAYALPPDAEVAGIGPVDPEIGLLRLDRKNGQPLAVVYNFACHPIQGVPSRGNTADIPGFASRVIEENLGDGVLAFFVQGCAGDINPVQYKDVHNPRDAEPLGNLLGLSAMRALKKIPTRENGELRVLHEVIALPRGADLEQRIAALQAEQSKLLQSLQGTSLNLKTFIPLLVQYKVSGDFPSYYSHRYLRDKALGRDDLNNLDAENRANMDAYIQNIMVMEQLTRIQVNLDLLKMHLAQNVAAGMKTIDVEIMSVRIGDFVLVTFPGELSVEIGLNIKKAAPHPFTFVAGYSNGYIYYTPTEQQRNNTGFAQEDCDCLVAPEWQKLFEAKAGEMLKKL